MTNKQYQDLDVKGILNALGSGSDLEAVIRKIVFDFEHPIGNVQEQRPNEPTPAEKYGMGTWTLDTTHNGRTEIGASDEYALGSTGGSETHSHSGTSLYGLLDASDSEIVLAPKLTGESYHPTYKIGVNSTYWDTTEPTHKDGIEIAGNTEYASSMQPYIAINYWKRVA